MKNIFFAITVLMSITISVHAAEIGVVGYKLSSFEQKALEKVLEKNLPGSAAELKVLKSEVGGVELVSIRANILYNDELLEGIAPGFGYDLFSQSQEAIRDAVAKK